jgi:hypothetical protein
MCTKIQRKEVIASGTYHQTGLQYNAQHPPTLKTVFRHETGTKPAYRRNANGHGVRRLQSGHAYKRSIRAKATLNKHGKFDNTIWTLWHVDCVGKMRMTIR